MFFSKGMEKDCLDMIFDHIKGKAKNIRLWRGIKRTKTHQISDQYLKVSN
jgi:hypothetical protein